MTTDEIIRRYGDEDGFIECADCPVHPKCAGYMSGFEDCWEKIRRHVSGEGEKRTGMADEDALERINRYTRRPYKAEEVYTFSVVLCDNEVDRDYECFTRDALGKLAVLFEGKTGLLDHEHTSRGQSARIYAARVKDFPEKRTSRGEPYAQLTAEAYVPRNAETAAFIESIESGIRKEVSVGCAVAKRTCSVCGAEHCAHQRGRLYDGERCVRILDEPTDAYEFSFVAPTTSGLQTLKQDSEKRAAMMTGEKIPCSLCRYAPPSDDDGKPCTCCPAEGV